MRSIPWLHAMGEEVVPREPFEGLTPRQRAILPMLLDGLARKSIAARFHTSEETVGTHIKAIYRRCGVNSVAESAGLFLKGV